MNRVVVRYVDGRVVKGTTTDFVPGKSVFHLIETGAAPDVPPREIMMGDLKALFFVKDLAGDPQHVEGNEFDPVRPAVGRRVRVVFGDGEVLVGVTQGYQPGRPGFFMEPADRRSNIERCYIVAAATSEVSLF